MSLLLLKDDQKRRDTSWVKLLTTLKMDRQKMHDNVINDSVFRKTVSHTNHGLISVCR